MTYDHARSTALFLLTALAACSDDATGNESTATTGVTPPDTTGADASSGGETPTTTAGVPSTTDAGTSSQPCRCPGD